MRAVEIEHKGGRTFGYRVDDEHGSIGLPARPRPGRRGVRRRCCELLAGVDVLLHDAQFLEGERPARRRLRPRHGRGLRPAGAGAAVPAALVLFHHSPARTDDALDEIATMYPSDFVTVATQGDEIEVPAPSPVPSS